MTRHIHEGGHGPTHWRMEVLKGDCPICKPDPRSVAARKRAEARKAGLLQSAPKPAENWCQNP